MRSGSSREGMWMYATSGIALTAATTGALALIVGGSRHLLRGTSHTLGVTR